MNINYKIFIGLNDKDLHKQIIESNEVKKTLSILFDCFTLTESVGYWNKEKENTLIVDIISNENERENIYNKVRFLKQHLNQECILITETILNDVKFI